ncbi:hypothetical protein CC77DRAFT_926292, partial [Alternaria alternata]
NLTILEHLDKVLVAGKPQPPPPAPRPPPPPPPARILPADDEVWKKCREKGCMLSWAMRYEDSQVGTYYVPPHPTAASPYQSLSDLARWFWFRWPQASIREEYFDFNRAWGIGHALEELGVNPYADEYEGGENRVHSVDHKLPPDNPYHDIPVADQKYKVNGKTYRATAASFSFSLNPKDGVIIGLNRESPKATGKQQEPPVPDDQMPELTQFSDVAWLSWDDMVKEKNGDLKNIRYLISVLVVNRETVSVVLRASENRGWGVEDWPGHIFEDGSPEMHAIMGKQGFAYMLIQHKAQLGNLYVSKIQVFRCETLHRNPCIVAHVSQPGSGLGGGPELIPNEGVAEQVSVRGVRRDENHNLVRTHKIFANL